MPKLTRPDGVPVTSPETFAHVPPWKVYEAFVSWSERVSPPK
jgi:hypothetical protein